MILIGTEIWQVLEEEINMLREAALELPRPNWDEEMELAWLVEMGFDPEQPIERWEDPETGTIHFQQEVDQDDIGR